MKNLNKESIQELLSNFDLEKYAKNIENTDINSAVKAPYNLDNASIIEIIQYIRAIVYELAKAKNSDITVAAFDLEFRNNLKQFFAKLNLDQDPNNSYHDKLLSYIFRYKPTVDHKYIENHIPHDFRLRDLGSKSVKPLVAAALLYCMFRNYDSSTGIYQNISKHRIKIVLSIASYILLEKLLNYAVVHIAYAIELRKNDTFDNQIDGIKYNQMDDIKYQIVDNNVQGTQAKGTILYFHGNCESVEYPPQIDGYNLIAIEYPSYSGLKGLPYKQNIEKRIDLTWENIQKEYAAYITDKDIIALGHSIGGYHAARFAQKHPDKVKGLMLASTYSNLTKAFNYDQLYPVISHFVCGIISIIRELICTEILNTEEILKALPPSIPVAIVHNSLDPIFNCKSNPNRNYNVSRSICKTIDIINLHQHPIDAESLNRAITRLQANIDISKCKGFKEKFKDIHKNRSNSLHN